MDGTQQEAPKLLFQSTPSARRATQAEREFALWSEFQSTPSARRATQWDANVDQLTRISIHALREEGD